MYGWTTVEAVGKKLSTVPEQIIPETEKLLNEVKAGRVITDHETIRRRKDGSLFDVSSTISAIKDAGGNVVAFAGISRDITQRKKAEAEIRHSLKEKETLLREIHHRVKNNMQIISSLLRLQSKYIKNKDDVEIFKESHNRISSMALIHEKLYQSRDFTNIDFNVYVRDLVRGLFHSYGTDESRIKLKISLDNIPIGIDSAIPCGLIINELITNSLKYAFPDDRKGEINICMGVVGENEFELTISDNGVGIPEGIDFERTDTLGLHLVKILAENQLQGEITPDRTNGTKFRIKFKGAK
jgi:PAS domain S-box-containing protein